MQTINLPRPMIYPIKNLRMPNQGVLLIKHKMTLIREAQESTRHTERLENIEHGDSLAVRKTVVQLTVHDELWGGEVRVLPEIPIEFLLDEP